mmetsp:Transcript_92039/g.259418  ORF Transcript_92039/g.259418 Transcript_92039/m.259418 type:complete len:459 (-) Transcript_92039:53-1429(-)
MRCCAFGLLSQVLLAVAAHPAETTPCENCWQSVSSLALAVGFDPEECGSSISSATTSCAGAKGTVHLLQISAAASAISGVAASAGRAPGRGGALALTTKHEGAISKAHVVRMQMMASSGFASVLDQYVPNAATTQGSPIRGFSASDPQMARADVLPVPSFKRDLVVLDTTEGKTMSSLSAAQRGHVEAQGSRQVHRITAVAGHVGQRTGEPWQDGENATSTASDAFQPTTNQVSQTDDELRREYLRLRDEDQELRRQNQDLRMQLPDTAAIDSEGASMLTGKKTWVWVTGLGIGCVLVCGFVSFQAFKFAQASADEDGDGDVDLEDVEKSIQNKFLCGLSWPTIKNLMLLLLLAIAGFTFLWWAGIIQPFLQQMVVYLYLASVILGFLAVVVYEAWDDIGKMQGQIMKVVRRVSFFFEGGFQDLEEEVESWMFGKSGRGSKAGGGARSGRAQRTSGCC